MEHFTYPTELIGEVLSTRYISHGAFYLPNRTHRRTIEYDFHRSGIPFPSVRDSISIGQGFHFHRSGISDFIGGPLCDIYIGYVTFQNKTELIGEPLSRRYMSQETF